MKNSRIFLSVCLVLSIFVGCGDKKEDKEYSEITQQKSTPKEKPIVYPVALKTVDGKEISVSKIDQGFKFAGIEKKAVLVNFFATWCPPCKAEIPHLNNLQKEYKDSLEIISIVMEDKGLDEIKNFIQEYEINYTITHGKKNFEFARAVGDVKAIPFMILYDKSGKYATHYVGAIPEEMLDVDIRRVVK